MTVGKTPDREYTQREATAVWNAVAPSWGERFGRLDPNRMYVLDNVLCDLLGDAKGKRVLDAGCGDGYLSRKLAAMGARTIGLEASSGMLSLSSGAECISDKSPAYILGDITNEPLAGDAFDCIVSNVVLVDVPDIQAAYREFFRVLRPGGSLVFSTIHPCFFSRESGWVKDEQGEKLHFRMDRYFERGAVEDRAWVDGQTPMVSFHHTLEDVVDGLLAAGFLLRRLVEPVPPPEYYAGHPERLDYGRIPYFLVAKAEKP